MLPFESLDSNPDPIFLDLIEKLIKINFNELDLHLKPDTMHWLKAIQKNMVRNSKHKSSERRIESQGEVG